jgi:hypothetical protein
LKLKEEEKEGGNRGPMIHDVRINRNSVVQVRIWFIFCERPRGKATSSLFLVHTATPPLPLTAVVERKEEQQRHEK